jgi:type I restriction enzyme S subunit
MKAGWKIEPLGELCEFQRGLTYAKGDEVDISDNVVLRATNIELTTNLLNFDELKYISDKVVVPDSKKVKKGSLMICTASGSKSHLGKVAYIDDDYDYAFGGFMGMVTPKNGLNSKYLFHLMTSPDYKDFIGALSDGANINNLKFDDLRKFPIPYPKPDEQQRIVGLLDEAFAGIATAQANAEKNLQNARALFASHLQSVFTQRGKGWVEIQLAEVCERLHQGLNTAGEKVKFYDSGYPIIQTRNIDDGVVELDSKIKFMCEEDWQLYKDKYRPEVGDVFFTNIGTIGKTAIVTTDRDYLIHWNIFKLRPRLEKITSEFLRYTLEQLTLAGYFEKMQKGGTVDFVTKKMISEALIYLPTIAEQKTTVAILDDLREETQRLASLYERKLTALSALKQSLLHQAFTGNL